jgi:hypothetical protein
MRALRISVFVLSLLVIATMTLLAGYVASRWHLYGPAERATFAVTAGVWALALVTLAVAGRSGRAAPFVASAFLFLLTLAGQVASYVAFSVD